MKVERVSMRFSSVLTATTFQLWVTGVVLCKDCVCGVSGEHNLTTQKQQTSGYKCLGLRKDAKEAVRYIHPSAHLGFVPRGRHRAVVVQPGQPGSQWHMEGAVAFASGGSVQEGGGQRWNTFSAASVKRRSAA